MVRGEACCEQIFTEGPDIIQLIFNYKETAADTGFVTGVIFYSPGNGMNAVFIFGCIQVEIPDSPAAVGITGKEVLDISAIIIIDWFTQVKPIHKNMNR
jgi:hypothetical protein